MKGTTLALVCLGLIVYVAVGGIIFSALETPREEDSRVDGVALRQAFLSKLLGHHIYLSALNYRNETAWL